jgi:hypothetical protein
MSGHRIDDGEICTTLNKQFERIKMILTRLRYDTQYYDCFCRQH